MIEKYYLFTLNRKYTVDISCEEIM